MINLRYHIVSIVAVFLGLAVGVVMGSTVIANSELDFLRDRLDRLDTEIGDVRARNADLRRENEALTRFQREAEVPLLAGDLAGVPVTVIGVQGIDEEPAQLLREQLANAGAQSQGTIWLTRKLRLDSQADIDSLAAALGVPAGTAEETRAIAIAALAQSVGGVGSTPSPVPALLDAGFVEVEAPPEGSGAATTTTTGPLGVVPAAPPMQVIVMSGAGAEMSDDEVAIPLVRALGDVVAGVVAVEAGNDDAGGREVFVGPFRREGELAPGVSTVDNVEAFAGRAAVVVLLRQPPIAEPGHYGVGPQAASELPPPVAES